jgi:hypothetical protein
MIWLPEQERDLKGEERRKISERRGGVRLA